MSEIIRDSQWDRSNAVANILDKVKIPRMAKIEQIFNETKIDNISEKIKNEISKPEIIKTIKKDANIAITCGSRGIDNIAIIIKEIVNNVKSYGGKPFVIPAMGSHGGSTAEGQRKVLEGLGVTENFIGAPIISTMETKLIGYNKDNKPIYIDKNAANADGIIIIGRIKPHTSFRGSFESGLYKMMVIGLGKQKGAQVCHMEGFGKMAYNMMSFAHAIIKNLPILFGLAIIENAYDKTCIIKTIPTCEIEKKEPKLLIKAKQLMPKILFPKFDILIIDQIGKNFSGDGMDPNITGTYCTPFASGGPDIKRYVVLDLSDETKGNSVGVGMADFTTKRLFDKTDFDQGYPNALTSTVVKIVKMPMVLKNDKKAIQAAIFTSIDIDKENPKIIRIMNSSNMKNIWISESLYLEAKKNQNIRFLEDFGEMKFNERDNLF